MHLFIDKHEKYLSLENKFLIKVRSVTCIFKIISTDRKLIKILLYF